jgi:hypothetical protein
LIVQLQHFLSAALPGGYFIWIMVHSMLLIPLLNPSLRDALNLRYQIAHRLMHGKISIVLP